MRRLFAIGSLGAAAIVLGILLVGCGQTETKTGGDNMGGKMSDKMGDKMGGKMEDKMGEKMNDKMSGKMEDKK